MDVCSRSSNIYFCYESSGINDLTLYQTRNCLRDKRFNSLPNDKYVNQSRLKIHKKTITICLNPFPNKPWFLRVCNTSPLKTPWEKEKLLVTSNFSFSHRVFYLFGELSAIFIKFEIVVCKLFQFGRV